jgi:N-acetylmuramic acid 6-phosphate (MurNAc-6-P) etherase
MTQAEDAIRRALSPEDLRAYDALGRDLSPIAEAVNAFNTQYRLWAAIAGAGGALMVVGAAYCLWRFAQAPDIRGMLAWGGGAAFAVFSLGLLKMWFFLEMQKNSIMREVKRLEFQVASLATLIARPTA